MTSFQYKFCFIILTCVIIFENINCNIESDLYTKILNKHNPLVPPSSKNVTVNLSLLVSSILDIDTKNQQMTSRLILNLYWEDSTLSWSPIQYTLIDGIQLPSSKIWTPNIILWNSITDNFVTQNIGDVQISSTGLVHWSIPGTFKSTCTIDVTYYPFDLQACVLKFGSLDSFVQLGLHNHFSHANFDEYYFSVIWSIVEAPAYQNIYNIQNSKNIGETDVTYYLVIQRKTYWISQVYPLLILGFFTLVPCIVQGFFEKYIFQLFCLTGLFVVYNNTANQLPPTTLVTPHVFIYLFILIILNMIHLTLTCFVKHFITNWLDYSSKWISIDVVNRISKLLLVMDKREKREETEDEQHEGTKNDKFVYQIHSIFNRLIFIALVLGVIISTLHFLLAIPYPYNLNTEGHLIDIK